MGSCSSAIGTPKGNLFGRTEVRRIGFSQPSGKGSVSMSARQRHDLVPQAVGGGAGDREDDDYDPRAAAEHRGDQSPQEPAGDGSRTVIRVEPRTTRKALLARELRKTR